MAPQSTLLLLSCLSCLLLAVHAAWQENLRPRRYVRLDRSSTRSFSGNFTGRDYFRMLYKDDQYLVIGARDGAYNISLTNLVPVAKLDWPSNASTVELCKLKGKPEVDCQNYIRVLAKKDDGGLFVCGTNAFSPICRHYQITQGPLGSRNCSRPPWDRLRGLPLFARLAGNNNGGTTAARNPDTAGSKASYADGYQRVAARLTRGERMLRTGD
ncbi:semaphorin-1A-like [Amphibalanus amphitrite]|uniref:semaphorin-1A-like n=1 Tax=Amphibalanus amphitrite TaxID=1232801 RepID=UPI001C90FF70|nr:semaphorin-1A-like [Amphibalanus amphitrite]